MGTQGAECTIDPEERDAGGANGGDGQLRMDRILRPPSLHSQSPATDTSTNPP